MLLMVLQNTTNGNQVWIYNINCQYGLKQCKSLISENILGETVANPYIEPDVHIHGLL